QPRGVLYVTEDIAAINNSDDTILKKLILIFVVDVSFKLNDFYIVGLIVFKESTKTINNVALALVNIFHFEASKNTSSLYSFLKHFITKHQVRTSINFLLQLTQGLDIASELRCIFIVGSRRIKYVVIGT